jgi:hypothetical protein
MSLFGISFRAQSPLAWIVAVTLIIGGFYFFRKTQRVVQRSWNEVSKMMKEGR